MRTFDQLTISTPRLLLRPLTESDAAPLFAVFSDPRVMRSWSTRSWDSLEKAHEMIARSSAPAARFAPFPSRINPYRGGTTNLY